MEIHPHIGQSSPHTHVVAHHRYPNDYYLHSGQYSTVSGDHHSQFDFQQQSNANQSNNNGMDQEIKQEQIKMEAFGSPIDANLNSNLQFQIPTSSPSSSLMQQHSSTNAIDSLSPNQLNVGGLLNYAAAAFQPQLGNVLNGSVNDNRIGNSNSKHDRKRPYPCAMCSSRFGSKMELEEHQNSHTGQKPFECDICQSRFNRRSTLWNHKRIHSDSKPFSCSVCQMTFKWKNSLKCHKEMHLRKNETSSVMDNDIKMLTYATAAKKKMAECSSNGLPPAAAIQTVASRKKPSSSSSKKMRVKREQLQEQTVSTTTSTNLSLSLFGAGMDTQRSLLNDPQNHQQQDSSQHLAITHTSSHQNQQLDLSQFNHNNLLMQIYSGNNTASNQSATNTHSQLLTNEDVSALDLLNSSSSTNNSSVTNLNIDLLPTAQGPLFLDNSQFLSDATVAMSNAASMRLPATFPMNVLDFQQQLTDRQQPQLPYIQTQQQDVANQQLQQQTMLNYQTPRADQTLLDDMQNLYQQGALDPSLLLQSNTQHSAHHIQQQSIQTNQMLQAQNPQQQQQMDQFSDFMLNGTPVYQFGGGHTNISDGNSVATAGVSLGVQQQPTLNNMTFNSNMTFAANQQMIGTNFNLMDDVSQFSQEELQNLAKMMPFENPKW